VPSGFPRLVLLAGAACLHGAFVHAAEETPNVIGEVQPKPAVEIGCEQLQFAYDAPQIEFDERLIMNADQALLAKGGLSNLAGAVTIRQGDKVFSAEQVDFDEATRQVTVKSESLFRNKDVIIRSREAQFDLNGETGAFVGTEFTLPGRAARGEAERIEIDSKGRARLFDASYTTCGPTSDAWYLDSSDIRLDHKEGLGTARHTRLRLMNVPVIYLPYFQFPIDDRRRTGLLYPTIGTFSGAGVDMRWPVYINLAPNYDATVTPRYMAERGLQSGVDFRYLLEKGEGSMRYEYLDDRKYGQDRSLFKLDHHSLINSRLALQAKYAESSDREYFEDLGGTLSSSSITHLEQTAKLTYQAPASYTITALVQNFQPIATTLTDIDDPYKRLPQIRFRSRTPRFFDTRAGIESEYVNFARDDSVEGSRLVLAPYLQFERQSAAWYVTGQADLSHTRYELTETEAGQPQSPDRTLPVVSAETGLRFERITEQGRLQTLTPRAFALYVPYENQDDLPIFDTGEPDFDFVQLLARNRFSGDDRLADARHIAGAATLRELDPDTGEALWSASIGQLYRFEAPRVALPDVPPPERGATEFIGQFDYRLSRSWRAVVAAQWAPEDSEFERTQVGFRYRNPDRRHQFDIAYRYRRDILEQADMSFLTPIGGGWKFAARTRYSLKDSESRENFAGIEYGTCCWAVRVSWRRFIADASGDFDSGVYLQLQLKGLGSLGAGGDTLLPDSEIDGERPR
jgi:LPS-assembly protein